MIGMRSLALCGVLTFLPAGLLANPIPIPVPASMPLEEMTITIGADRRVTFVGEFTFDSIPTTVTSMLFPLPPINAAAVRVFQDTVELRTLPSFETYPTALPEYPTLPMFEWSGPFPEDGTVFTVQYQHEVFLRGDEFVFFYSLGTGKYFPTYDKETTARFQIQLPDGAILREILLDDMPIDPGLYVINGSRIELELTSEFGPFTKDLIMLISIPQPSSLWLLVVGLLGMIGLGAGVAPTAVQRGAEQGLGAA